MNVYKDKICFRTKTLSLIWFLLSSSFGFCQFKHPGILVDISDFEKMKTNVDNKVEPWYSYYTELKSIYSSNWIPSPVDTINVGYGEIKIGEKEFFKDGDAAYSMALLWILTQDEVYAKKAIEILNKWSLVHKAIINKNRKLITSMGAIKFVATAEVMKNLYPEWHTEDQIRFEKLVFDVWYQNIKDFAPNYNGNWDASVIQTMMAIGIYLDNYQIFIKACHQFLSGESNGSIANYIDQKGQSQESGRDQGHVQMGLGYLSMACEIAWVQGIDLYSAFDNRLLKGYEYTSKYMLGGNVDYEPFRTFNGKTVFGEQISSQGRGIFESVYGLAFNHYSKRKKLKMPYTEKALMKAQNKNKGGAFLPFINMLSKDKN